MQKVQNILYQLESSINALKIDFQLLERLKTQLDSKKISVDSLQQQMKILLHIYDLSNNQKLYTIKKTSITMNQMAIQLKIMVCQLMSTVITYFERQQSITLIPIQFLAQGIEIMIISARICLNQGDNKFISQLQQCYKFIHSPYEYVLEFLPKNVQFFHQLNTLELIRYKCENQSFTILNFQKRLSILSTYDELNLSEYQNFISNIVMEIVLKSLKNGKLSPEKIQLFTPYLTEQNQKQIQSLIIATGTSTKNLQTSSQFLEIYHQINNYGIENINMSFLEQFMKNQKNFNDERIFQIAALTLEPEFLQMWFNILNNKKDKHPTLQKAFLCFIHIVETILGLEKAKKDKKLTKLLKLSNTIIFTLLTQKKSAHSQHPVLNIIKTFMKVLTQLCFSNLHEWKQIQDFGERIVLICSRFQIMQISKVIYTLLLYCSLIKKEKAQEIYQKFLAYYNNEQSSEIFRLLSSAYLFMNSHKQNLSIQSLKNLNFFKQPFIMVLFSQNQEDMTIFDIDQNNFKEINKKFQVYFQMIKKYQNNQFNITKIIEHLQNYILKTRCDQLSKIIENQSQERNSLQNLLILLVEILEQKESINLQSIKNSSLENKTIQSQQNANTKKQDHNYSEKSIKICFILINLLIITNDGIVSDLKETSTGVLLNKYSQKVKLITGITDMLKKSQKPSLSPQFYNVCCCYLIMALEKFKKSFIKKERIGEPGQVSFIHAVSNLVQQIQKTKLSENNTQQMQVNPRKVTKSQDQTSSSEVKNNFISFIIFQIDCLTNNYQRYIRAVDQMEINALRTFSHSIHIPKILKQKILRRIVRQNLMHKGQNLTLRQFKEIIEITDDSQQLQLYMKYVLSCFGEDGRKMLLLLSHENKKLQRILLHDNQIQI